MNSPETNSFRNTPFQCDLDALMHAAQAFVSPHDVFKDEDRRSAKSGASLHLGRLKPARAKPPWCGTCPGAAQPYHSMVLDGLQSFVRQG